MSKELFQLIKSLNQSEKRYFKLYVRKRIDPKKSIAIQIFDTLAIQKEYNNKQLLAKLSLKNKNHLPMYKNMLQNMIIRELAVYRTAITPYGQVRCLLDECDYFFHKGLYSLCKKSIIKAKHLANRYEAFMYQVEILQYEIKIEKALGVNTSAIILDVHDEQKLLLEKQKNVVEYMKLLDELILFTVKDYTARTPEEMMSIKKIKKNVLLKSEERAISQYARAIYFFCNGTAAFIEGKIKKANYYIGKQVELINKHPQLIELNPYGYVGALSNFVVTIFYLGKYDEVEAQVKIANKIINALPDKLKHNLDSPILRLQNILLTMYIDAGQFEKGDYMATIIEKKLNLFDKTAISTFQLIPILFNLAHLNFCLLHYKKARIYINQLLNMQGVEARTDIQLFARIINIIIYFEMGERGIIPYLTKSLYRHLIQKKKLYKGEKLIVNWMRITLPKIKNNNNLIDSFRELKENMEGLISDPLEAKALEYFDFISWLDSKIQNRPFVEIVREKFLQKKRS